MIRTLFPVAALSLLMACGDGNPFFDDGLTDGEAGGSGADSSASNLYATELNADLTMNALSYNANAPGDPSDDTLTVNNLPFDNSDATGGGYTRNLSAALGGGFELYESNATGAPGERRYFAVFKRSSISQVAAVGTGDYVGFGFGGATAQPLGSIGIPDERPALYEFTGDYAAVRVTTLDGSVNDVEFITGDTTLFVDIADFDVNGAVEGLILNRVLYDSSGTQIGTLNDSISLATAEIDFSNGTIGSSTARGLEGLTELTTGNWQGIFAGPNGEEIAGMVVVEGTVASGADDDEVRETGVFITVNQG